MTFIVPIVASVVGALLSDAQGSKTRVRMAKTNSTWQARVRAMLDEIGEMTSKLRSLSDDGAETMSRTLRAEIQQCLIEAHEIVPSTTATMSREFEVSQAIVEAINKTSAAEMSEWVESARQRTEPKFATTLFARERIGEETLEQLIKMEAESWDDANTDDIRVTAEVLFREFQWSLALGNALARWIHESEDNWPKDYDDLDQAVADLMSGARSRHNNAPFLVFMTLHGHGIGIWDGSWDCYFESHQIEKLSKHLEKELRREHQNLQNAIDDAVARTIPVQEEEADEE
jgi:gas vesicle protein